MNPLISPSARAGESRCGDHRRGRFGKNGQHLGFFFERVRVGFSSWPRFGDFDIMHWVCVFKDALAARITKRSAQEVQSDKQFKLDRTNLLVKLGKIWGEVPIRLLQHLDLRNGVYGFVGLSDRTMFPIVRPGSIVQIDQNQRKVVQGNGRTKTTDRSISWNCAGNSFAVGARCSTAI